MHEAEASRLWAVTSYDEDASSNHGLNWPWPIAINCNWFQLLLSGFSYRFDGTCGFFIDTPLFLPDLYSRNSISLVDICSRYVLGQNRTWMSVYSVTQRAGGNLRRD